MHTLEEKTRIVAGRSTLDLRLEISVRYLVARWADNATGSTPAFAFSLPLFDSRCVQTRLCPSSKGFPSQVLMSSHTDQHCKLTGFYTLDVLGVCIPCSR